MTETADAAPSHARHSTRHAPQRHGPGALSLGDFTADRRMLMLVAMATLVGAAGAAGAWVLLRLIALVSNLVWLGRSACRRSTSPRCGPARGWCWRRRWAASPSG